MADVPNRPDLDRRTLSIVSLGMLSALNRCAALEAFKDVAAAARVSSV